MAIYGIGFLDVLRLGSNDITFTGRTDIWEFIYTKVQDNLALGYGFGGFWGLGDRSGNLTASYVYMWYLDSSHNGYLDIMIHLGVIGLSAVALPCTKELRSVLPE